MNCVVILAASTVIIMLQYFGDALQVLPSSSAFPAISLGFTILDETLCM